MIRIVLADDHPVVRAGLKALLAVDPDVDVVGSAATPEETVALVRQLAPDVVLMDLQFGGERTGADATAEIQTLRQPPAVLVLTNYDTDGDILSAVEAGACGYLLKDAPPDELVAAIRAAAVGESALAPAIAGRLLDRMRVPQQSLSAREVEVLTWVAAGASNSRIARELRITDATVKSHLVHIFTKLGVTSRTAAVAAGRSAGIVR